MTAKGELALRDQLRNTLLAVTAERDQRRRIITTTYGKESEWVVYERSEMVAAVNRLRAGHGWEPVGIDDMTRAVAQADRLATGHVDWLDKFSLYCAELVIHGPNWFRAKGE